jgi:hypothetical protein
MCSPLVAVGFGSSPQLVLVRRNTSLGHGGGGGGGGGKVESQKSAEGF